jgi:hypothetical protein
MENLCFPVGLMDVLMIFRGFALKMLESEVREPGLFRAAGPHPFSGPALASAKSVSHDLPADPPWADTQGPVSVGIAVRLII